MTTTLQIEGIATCTAIGNCSTFSRRVLYHTRNLHPTMDHDINTTISNKSMIYPISFSIPAMAEELDMPLPPSFYLRRPQTEANVRYSFRVLLTRKGLLRRNEE